MKLFVMDEGDHKISGSKIENDHSGSEVSVPGETTSVGPSREMGGIDELDARDKHFEDIYTKRRTDSVPRIPGNVVQKQRSQSNIAGHDSRTHIDINAANNTMRGSTKTNINQVDESMKNKDNTFDLDSVRSAPEHTGVSNAAKSEKFIESNSEKDGKEQTIESSENSVNKLSLTEANNIENSGKMLAENQTLRAEMDTVKAKPKSVTSNNVGPLSHSLKYVPEDEYNRSRTLPDKESDVPTNDREENSLCRKGEDGSGKGEVGQSQGNGFPELTKENLRHHVEILCETSAGNEVKEQEEIITEMEAKEALNECEDTDKMENNPSVGKDSKLYERRIEAIQKGENEEERKEQKTPSIVHMKSVTPESKDENKTIQTPIENSPQYSVDVTTPETDRCEHKTTSTLLEQNQTKLMTKKAQNSKVKRKNKKKKRISVDDVETLVSRDKWSNSENRNRRKTKIKEIESINESFASHNELMHEDSGIENDIADPNDLNGNTGYKSGADDSRNYVGQGIQQKIAQNRLKPHKFTKRPVYDATNTSTKMILLNNKYGKHSRLWKTREPLPSRSTLIDPSRHLRESTFYLSGDFHSRCSTSESPERYKLPPSHFKFDFRDRHQGGKIGDRLSGARMSVNPNRHRTCSYHPEPKPKPMNFSPPCYVDTLPTYVFEWERLYAEPPPRTARPSSLGRPPSIVSGKKFGKETVKVPHLVHTSRTPN